MIRKKAIIYLCSLAIATPHFQPAAPGFRKDLIIQTYLLKRMPKTWKKDPLQKRKIV